MNNMRVNGWHVVSVTYHDVEAAVFITYGFPAKSSGLDEAPIVPANDHAGSTP
jgi:hypothetical protein